MKKIVALGVAVAVFAALAAPGSAEARYRGRGGGGDVAAGAILGIVGGLMLGSVIANANRGPSYAADEGYAYAPAHRAPQAVYDDEPEYRSGGCHTVRVRQYDGFLNSFEWKEKRVCD